MAKTLRKYSDVLEREGYDVRKNSRGRREYTDFDVVLIEQLVELSKQDGMTLEKLENDCKAVLNR